MIECKCTLTAMIWPMVLMLVYSLGCDINRLAKATTDFKFSRRKAFMCKLDSIDSRLQFKSVFKAHFTDFYCTQMKYKGYTICFKIMHRTSKNVKTFSRLLTI